MKHIIIAFFFSFLISLSLKAVPNIEVYGVKFNEIFLCQSASCSNAIKIGGGSRINIADPYFTSNIGTLIDLKKSNLGSNSYSHVKFNVDMKFVIKATNGSCYSFPTKVEPGYSKGTTDASKYGEQIIQAAVDNIDCEVCSNVTKDSFDFTWPLSGSYTPGTGKSIAWNIDVTNSIDFDGCNIGPGEPGLDFTVVQY
jgi:hypothetical protein